MSWSRSSSVSVNITATSTSAAIRRSRRATRPLTSRAGETGTINWSKGDERSTDESCHPERTREGSGPAVQGQILREYVQDDNLHTALPPCIHHFVVHTGGGWISFAGRE